MQRKMSGSSSTLESLGRVGVWTLPRVMWIIFLVLILVWIMDAEGGLGFTESSVFGWHPFLMTLAFGTHVSGYNVNCLALSHGASFA
jgi:hypothetical protein